MRDAQLKKNKLWSVLENLIVNAVIGNVAGSDGKLQAPGHTCMYQG